MRKQSKTKKYGKRRTKIRRRKTRRRKTRRAGSTKPRKSVKELIEERKAMKPTPAAPISSHSIPPIPNFKEQLTTYMSSRHPEEYIIRSSTPKVALLFMIIDDLPLENIWRDWLIGPNSHNVEIFIHAKYPERVRSRWVQDRLIRSDLRPSWGSIELSKAMYYLLEDALQFRAFTSDYFIFLSESCIPLYNIDEFFRRLQGQTKSWIDYNNTATNGYAYTNQFAPLKDVVPNSCVYKSDQWVMLNRANAIQLIDFKKQTNISIWSLMENIVSASDEMWIPTILCIMNNGLENIVEKRKITYVDWGEETRSPITFEEITPVLVETARGKGCLFMRKFKARNPMWLVDDWHKNVL